MTSESATDNPSEIDQGAAHTKKVVVGIDGSPPSLRAMEWAARQAELTGATLEVAMVWEWPIGYGRTPMLHEEDPVHNAREIFEEAVDTVRGFHPELDTSTLFERGHPAPALVEASKDADLLVVGCRGHGEFLGMLLGSVSQHCATKAQCPVLIHHDAH